MIFTLTFTFALNECMYLLKKPFLFWKYPSRDLLLFALINLNHVFFCLLRMLLLLNIFCRYIDLNIGILNRVPIYQFVSLVL